MVSRRKREVVSGREPIHVTARLMEGLPCLRRIRTLGVLKGKVFTDRYHAHVLRTPREVRNALVYVLQNARRHGARLRGRLDPYASGFWFEGWKEGLPRLVGEWEPRPVARARTWLLKAGWRKRLGLIGREELPIRRAA